MAWPQVHYLNLGLKAFDQLVIISVYCMCRPDTRCAETPTTTNTNTIIIMGSRN